MTPEQAKELLPVIIALSEGRQVQYFDGDDDAWCDIKDPSFTPKLKWRIKPDAAAARAAWRQAVLDKMEEVRVSSASRRETLESELCWLLEHHPDTPKESK